MGGWKWRENYNYAEYTVYHLAVMMEYMKIILN